jgi:hypothetical protein
MGKAKGVESPPDSPDGTSVSINTAGAVHGAGPAGTTEPHRVLWRLQLWRERSHEQEGNQVSPEVRGRAVRLVREQRSEHPSIWAAVESIGCKPQTLHEWVSATRLTSVSAMA